MAAFRNIKGDELTRRIQHAETVIRKILKDSIPGQEMVFGHVDEELTRITVEVNELSKFTRINYSGFIKIIKKHDKHTGYELRACLICD